jgi:hypothetical protein
MAPEKIRIVHAPLRAAAPARGAAADAAKADPVSGACLSWGVFIGPPDAARADAAMAEAKLPPAQVRRVLTDVDGHWVLIPPQKSQADINKVIEELKKLGVTEYSVVPEPPQWRNAISLGIFRTEESARNLLADLKTKGVTEAGLERRERFFQQMTYYVREPDEATVAKLATLRTRIAGSEVKAVGCPPQFEGLADAKK